MEFQEHKEDITAVLSAKYDEERSKPADKMEARKIASWLQEIGYGNLPVPRSEIKLADYIRQAFYRERLTHVSFFDNLTLVEIPAGSFMMGSPPDESGRWSSEGPQHKVTLKTFYLSATPITQAQWREVAQWVERPGEKWGHFLDTNPSGFTGDNRPVERVSWHEAMEFCSRLSQRTGQTYTLPSEAQWEYACRAGTITPFYCGNTLSDEDANYYASLTRKDGQPAGRYIDQTTDVGSFPANPWGLYDMHGNVFEWCLDDWHDNYEGAPADGSAWVMDNGLGKSLGAVAGSAARRAAARPSAATPTPPMPTSSSASVYVEDKGLKKPSGVVPGSAGPGPAALPAETSSTPPLPTTSSASGCVEEGDMQRRKVLRGGSCFNLTVHCSSASRFSLRPANAGCEIGFRVSCPLTKQS